MTNTALPAVAAKIRYYTDAGTANMAMHLPALDAVIHKLLCRWTRLNYHCRDFETAIEFEALGLYTDYLLAGSPVFSEPDTVPDMDTALAACPSVPETTSSGPLMRFYDDEGHLNGAMDMNGIRAALVPFFIYGLVAGWNPRDFVALAKDIAASAIYDLSISRSMGGLGGCKTPEEFLTRFN
jgi:hypothetical protein